jgi:hypothetical protein
LSDLISIEFHEDLWQLRIPQDIHSLGCFPVGVLELDAILAFLPGWLDIQENADCFEDKLDALRRFLHGSQLAQVVLGQRLDRVNSFVKSRDDLVERLLALDLYLEGLLVAILEFELFLLELVSLFLN